MKVILSICLILFGFTSCNYLSKKSINLCPIQSNYSFIDVDFDLYDCFQESRKFHCEFFNGGASYGYKVFDTTKGINPREYNKILALRINDESDFEDLNKFVNLEYLYLFAVKKIPSNIKYLKNLKILLLDSSGFQEIPDWIGEMSNLEVLSVNRADNIIYLTPEIHKLSNLKELYLQRFHRLKLQFIDYSKFQKLEKLILSDNSEDLLNKTIKTCKFMSQMQTKYYHQYIADLVKLKLLVIDFVTTDTDLTAINKLKKLEELFIVVSYEFATIDKRISEIPKLRNLGINFSFTRTKINEVKLNFPKLEYLFLRSYYLDQIPTYNMPNLKYLACWSIEEENNILVPNELLNYKKLRYADISGKGIKGYEFNINKCHFKTKK